MKGNHSANHNITISQFLLGISQSLAVMSCSPLSVYSVELLTYTFTQTHNTGEDISDTLLMWSDSTFVIHHIVIGLPVQTASLLHFLHHLQMKTPSSYGMLFSFMFRM